MPSHQARSKSWSFIISGVSLTLIFNGCGGGSGGANSTDVGIASDSDDAHSSSTPTNPDTGIGEIVERFVIIGDSGKAGDGQMKVGAAVAAACQARGGCDFGILNGDNVYPAGVLSATDPLWATHFEAAFGSLDFPFYAALGNHDYGGITETDEISCSTGLTEINCLSDIGSAIGQATGGIGLDPARSLHQVDYARISPNFIMDANHYTFKSELIDFAVLDTTPIYWNDANNSDSLRLSALREVLDSEMFEFASTETTEQEDAMDSWRASSTKRWRFAIAHHPYLSNGSHGNAGSYDGTGGLEGSGLPDGTQLKAFLETYVIEAGVHVYAYGHDHNLMDLGEHTLAHQSRGTQMLLSGAGSKINAARSPENAQNDALFEITCFGFIMVEASEEALRFHYIVAPSGAESDCSSQNEPWLINHTRVVEHYEPG